MKDSTIRMVVHSALQMRDALLAHGSSLEAANAGAFHHLLGGLSIVQPVSVGADGVIRACSGDDADHDDGGGA